MSSKAEVVIVGGGAVGCSIAYHLAKQGVASQIIERDAIASQASGKAWAVMSAPASIVLFWEGIYMPKGSMWPSFPLFEEGLRRFPELAPELKAEGGIDIQYGELPAIRVVFQEDEEKHLKQQVCELAEKGFQVSWIDEYEVRARLGDVTPGVRGAVFLPGHQVEPYRYVLGLFQAAEAKGASMKQGEAVGLRYQGSRVMAVTLATGEVEADVVVLAMGPWNKQSCSWLGKELPSRVTRAECLRVEVPQRLPPYRIYNAHGVIVPKVDGTVVLAAQRENHPDEVDFDDRPTEEAKNTIIEATVDLVPGLIEAKLVEHRSALLDRQPNGGLPMMGQVPGWDNVYLATWMGGFGIMWSPAVGRIMADLIVKGRTEDYIELLSPARLIPG